MMLVLLDLRLMTSALRQFKTITLGGKAIPIIQSFPAGFLSLFRQKQLYKNCLRQSGKIKLVSPLTFISVANPMLSFFLIFLNF